MKRLSISLLNFYQTFLSPGGACKYKVSCSEYTKQMIREFGVGRGSWMGVCRIWSCR